MTGDSPEAAFHRVCPAKALREREGKSFVVMGRAVAVFKDGGGLHAISDRCPHNGMPLHDGNLECGILTCRWHGWQFDVTTGRTPGTEAGALGPRLRVYSVRESEGWIEVSL